MIMEKTAYTHLITDIATIHGVDPILVEAVVVKESSGNTFAWNPEPRYRYLWDVRKSRPFRQMTPKEASSAFPPLDFPAFRGDPDQEYWGQRASWGLLQIMGAVAREYGFKRPYLTELTDPRVNLDIGVKHLNARLQWAGGDVIVGLAGYNAGTAGGASGAKQRAGRYPEQVVAIYDSLKSLHT